MEQLAKRASMSSARVSMSPTTIADLIDRASTDATFSKTRQRDVVSALRRTAAWFGLDPDSLPAAHRPIAERFAGLHWKQLGLSRKTFQNVRANVQFALDRYVAPMPAPRGKGLAAPWAELWHRLPAGELRYRLSRLIGFSSDRDISPEAVDDAVAAVYRDWLVNETLLEKPDAVFRAAMRAWNKAVDTVEDWPKRRLTLPSNSSGYCLSWDDLPAAFCRDAEAWLARNANPDPLDDDAPPRPWSAATLQHRRFQLRQLASALHCAGYDISELGGLADLVALDTAKTALRFFLDRGDGETSSQIAGFVAVFAAIAEYWVKVDREHLQALKRIKTNLAYRQNGLTSRNRRRLQQFADRDNLIAFLGLPQKIFVGLKRQNRITRQQALDMQVALGIEILLMAPVRRRNLVSLDLERHILVQGRGPDARLFIDFPAATVKNRVDLTYPIPAESAKLLDFYLKRCLPVLDKHGTTWLFPGAKPGAHKAFDRFSNQFTKTIRRYTGLEMNLHLMRHFGAKLYLDRNPGAYEVVRRVLGHKRMSTTVTNYTGLDSEAAIRHFDAVILGIRNDILRGDADD